MSDKKPGPAKPGLVVRQDNRKPLFSTRQTVQETRIPALSRSKSSPGAQDRPLESPATPGGSRIPRFGSGGFGSRQPLSLTEAFKLAGEEDRPRPVDGSPSPAPRLWRRPDLRQTEGTKAVSPNKERIAMRNRVDDGIGKSRTSRWVLEEGMRDDALSSTENAGETPEKSFAWQVDEDFTAGDLLVSDSPRIRVNKPPFAKSPVRGTPNTKLDEIRTRELGLTPNVGGIKATKLDDIRLREKQADLPLLERGFPRIGGGHTKLDEIKQREMQGLSKRAIAQAKLEDIKERNAMTRSVSPESPRRNRGGLVPRSKSAFEPAGRQVPDTPVTIYKSEAERAADVRRAAAKKAEEKKEAETHANRANGLSPQKRDQSRDLLRKLARATSASPGERTSGSTVDEPEARTSLAERIGGSTINKAGARASLTERIGGSAINKPEPRASSLKPSALVDRSRRRTSNTSESKSASSSDRPTVGFAGLARARSSDSHKSKGSSMHSEQDPTDRIEAEERLFAPLDNYSERGSVRAPSPWVEEDNNATPKPPSKDFLSMPTPRAPGAFVDTPVTLKKEDRAPRRRMSLEESPDVKPATVFLDKKTDLAWRSKKVDTASDPGAAEEKPTRPTRSRSLPRRRPLTNSAKLPSVRDDLRELQRIHNIDDGTLDNLEDILLGKKTTDEKLDELLKEIPAAADAVAELKDEERAGTGLDERAAYEALSASVERDLGVHKGGNTKVEEPPRKNKHETEKKHTTDKQAKMDALMKTETLKTETLKSEPGVENEMGIHETPASNVGIKNKTPANEAGIKLETPATEKHQHAHEDDCPLCVAKPAHVAYLHLPLPRLFHARPNIRLTLLGVLLCALSLWYAAETTMCRLHCRPTTCAGETPCVWSFDDPVAFGTALPIKLDQWATGGRGRAAWDEARDWAADVLLLERWRDVEALTTEQQRRVRRRAVKRRGLTEEQRLLVDAWRRQREMEDGVRRGVVSEESVGGDERLWE
ncbi:hypothetical protein LEL_08709 [Akanthomyces lecanii RCEF 1005]|uniref:Uncharacterized protein n=1 Tax=Akanthomyces lecanii RCEF 1005 TaxID=1081108 RepID=A0A168DRL4_CORDF|nr:hypothetical protein LEL_08709 [Akanthomyces lecanii RCEF 1005]